MVTYQTVTCVKDYLNCEKTWDKLKIKNMGDYYDQYFKKYVLLLADFLKIYWQMFEILWTWPLSLF